MATRFQFIYSEFGLALGLVCIIGGIILSLHSIFGSSSWTTKFLGLESELSGVTPGVILFVIGLLITFFTRFDIRTVERRKQQD